MVGISIGALIHGYVPEALMLRVMGGEAWWSVPAAVIVGVPMYTNAAGVIPIVEALLGKGAALGTTLAFMMSVIALSLPEMIILKQVLTYRLIAIFIAVVSAGILATGFLFNLIGANAYMTINPIHQVVMGGFMFGMVFMATDPVSAAQTNKGKLWYGFFGGLFSIMIRVFNPAYPEGVMMAILFMNVMAPLIDHYVIEGNIKRREKRLTVAAA